MGDISIIARRLEGEKYVQYGWSGNGGYFSMVGARLLFWYDDPEKVRYLFSLGQLRMVGEPGSENGGASLMESNLLTHRPHWLGESEREIFSKIHFIDYGYFYETDNRWYYIIPGPFRIKIPLEYMENHLDERGNEFDERERIEHMVLDYILGDYFESNTEFRTIVEKDCASEINTIREKCFSDRFPTIRFMENYQKLFDYFDDWIVVKTDEDMESITGFIVRKRQNDEKRIETNHWK